MQNPGWPSVVLNVKTDHSERKDIQGPFSVFLNISGKSNLTVDKKEITLGEETFIFTNPGQHYDLLINEPGTETLNLHFGERLYLDALWELINPDSYLLDNPISIFSQVQFPVYTMYKDQEFINLVCKVYQTEDKELMINEEAWFNLLNKILFKKLEIYNKANRLDLIKASTRYELISRLLRGRDYIHAHFKEDLALEQIAKESCLSKFHFLRTFKIFFEQTPHQYIKRLRANYVLQLLAKRKYTLDEIAHQIGMSCGSAVSRFMFNVTGYYPSAFKKE